MHGILDNHEVRVVNAAVAAANNTDDNSTRIDMSDYESVMFVVTITDSVNAGVATLTVQGNAADSDTGMTAIAGAAATRTAEADDALNGLALVAEVRNPATRYVQATITSTAANIAFGETLAILKPRRFPAVQGATVGHTAYVSG